MRSTKLIQVEVNQKYPTSVKHLLAGIIFSKVLLVWDEENEGFIVSNVGHKMSQVFRSIVYLVKGFQGCRSRLIVKLSHRLC